MTFAKLALGAALALQLTAILAPPVSAQTDEPSRAPYDDCSWEQRSDPLIGLGAWVQSCDFGFRTVELVFDEGALSIVYSDGGEPEPLVQLFDVERGEAPGDALNRLLLAGTDPAIAELCEIVPFTQLPAPAGAQRFSFEPDAVYRAEIAATANPNEVGEPPCGDWGVMPDGIQYFEVQDGAPRVMFVRAGQEQPLFDEQTLDILDLPDAALINTGPSDCCGYKTDTNGISADFLMETCSVPGDTAYGMVPNFDCQSYVLAVLDTVRAVNRGPGTTVCLPPVMTAGGALLLVAKTYSYEADGQRPAAEVLVEALGNSFACVRD